MIPEIGRRTRGPIPVYPGPAVGNSRIQLTARHYLRDSALSHKSEYNLVATSTTLPPEEDDRVQQRYRKDYHLRFV
jgi:hypothetical protein